MGCTAGKNEDHKIVRWYTHMLYSKTGNVPKMVENRTRFLPLEIKGCCVLIKEGGSNKYRIDNSKLQDRAHGVCFRSSKNIDDKDEEHIAFWNSVVRGEDTGDGWITTDIDEENLEFMEKMEKETPLETLKRYHQGPSMVSASSSSNVDGRWVARGHTGSKRIDGEAVQYGRGLSTTLVWEGLNSFSIDVMGERRRARLIDDTLVWNDGDVWTRDPKAIEVLKPKDIYGDVELEDGSALMPPISHICQKGMKPNSPNQDAWSVTRVEDRVSIYSVYDGHGPYGHDVANFVKDTLPRLLISDDRLETLPNDEMFLENYRRMHMLIDSADAHDKLSARWSGCTATTVVHHHQTGRLSIAHVGDSSVVVGGIDGRKSFAKQLTRDHKPQLKDEMARIVAAGGLIDFDGFSDYRIYNKDGYGAGLNMTRSIGDLEAHRETGLIADPEVSVHQIGVNDRVLLLCSDGIWEFIQPEEAVDIVLKFPNPSDAADALVKEARYRWTQQAEYIDDIVVLILPLSGSPSPRRSLASSGGA